MGMPEAAVRPAPGRRRPHPAHLPRHFRAAAGSRALRLTNNARHAARNPDHVTATAMTDDTPRLITALLTDPRTDNDTFGNLPLAPIATQTPNVSNK
jgi:hypothetical protein